jgi:hypothetical protein
MALRLFPVGCSPSARRSRRRTQNTSFRYHTTGGTLGFAVRMDARLIRHLSLLGDLTLDLGSPEALARHE